MRLKHIAENTLKIRLTTTLGKQNTNFNLLFCEVFKNISTKIANLKKTNLHSSLSYFLMLMTYVKF